MAFKMNPALKAYGKSAGDNRAMKMDKAMRMDPSAMKRAGYYEYDVDGNKKRITEAEYKEKEKTTSSVATAGVAKEKGKSGTIVADMSHGKAIIDKKTPEAKNAPEYKEAVTVGTKPRNKMGANMKTTQTTRYKEDEKTQAKFNRESGSGKPS